MKPVVDGLEQELAGQLLIIRLNIQESVGRELAPVYMFEYTPTFIFFDAQGRRTLAADRRAGRGTRAGIPEMIMRRLRFAWMYLRRPPWDSGITPPNCTNSSQPIRPAAPLTSVAAPAPTSSPSPKTAGG